MFKLLGSVFKKSPASVNFEYVASIALDREANYAMGEVQKDIVEKLSNKFIELYSAEILSKIDRKAVNNLVAMYVSKELAKEVK